MDKTIKGDNELKTLIPADNDSDQTVRQSQVILADADQPTVAARPPSAGQINAGATVTLKGTTYTVVQTLGDPSGEAEIFLMNRMGQEAVLKYYFQNFQPKEDVLAQLKGIRHPDIVEVLDYGWHGGRFFELMGYAAGGNLLQKDKAGRPRYLPMNDAKKIQKLVVEVVNALHHCHTRPNPIIHRDIKPHNIFVKNTDGSDYMIGDFGISSLLDQDLTRVMTGHAKTEVYAAPELNYNIKGKTLLGCPSDYYSLGITILHLWTSKVPFEGLSNYEITTVKISEKVDIPRDMPDRIKRLVRGLITNDAKSRWGHREVQEWLQGGQPPVHYGKASIQSLDEFSFDVVGGKKLMAKTPMALAGLMEKSPTQGIRHLYKGTIAKWVEKADQALYVRLRAIVEDDYPTDEHSGLTMAIYVLDQGRGFKTKGGTVCMKAEDIGTALMAERGNYHTQLADPADPLYVFIEAKGDKKVADAFRNYMKLYTPERGLNMIILSLHNGLRCGGKIYSDPQEMAADRGLSGYQQRQLAQEMSNSDSRFSIWLEGHQGYRDRIEDCRRIGVYSTLAWAYVIRPNSAMAAWFRAANRSRGLSQQAAKGIGTMLLVLAYPFALLLRCIFVVLRFVGKFLLLFVHKVTLKKAWQWALGMGLVCGVLRAAYYTFAWNNYSTTNLVITSMTLKAAKNGALAGCLLGAVIGIMAGIAKTRPIVFR